MTEVVEDSTPLLSKDGSPCSEDEELLSNVIFFHGKELRGALGKSFIRKPGTQQVLVRIGVGKEGVFKVDGFENKVLEHWKFSDLKDWSFSGYSFTLQFAVGPSYSVRTDDGEALCMYIEEFQKHPEEALKKARDNPPNSKIPESGIRTLRKKFSGADAHPPTPSEQVRFYTLNRRTSKKSADPTSKLAHNIEVDSRLRTAYAQESLSNSSSDMELGPRESFLHDKQRVNGIPEPLLLGTENKQHAHNQTNRMDDTPKHEKPVPVDVCSSPTSTRGEATRNQVTQHVPSSGKATPPKPSSPLLQRHVAQDQHLSLPGKQESGKQEDIVSPADLEEYYYLRPRSISETMGTRPINVVKGYMAPRSSTSLKKEDKGGEVQSHGRSMTIGSLGHASGGPQAQGSGKQKQKPPQLQQLITPPVNRGVSPSDSECSGDLTPLVVRASSSMSTSSGTYSPDEFQVLSPKQYQARVKELQEEPKWYENSPSPEEMTKARPVSPPYDTLSRSDSEVSSKLEFAGGIRSRHNDSDAESLRMSLSSPPSSSPTYDHLSNLTEGEGKRHNHSSKQLGPEKMDYLSAAMDVSIRRNVSQPVFGSGGGGGEGMGRGGRGGSRSSASPGPDSIQEETESDEELTFNSSFASESTSDTSGVVLRQKKERPQIETDPFEDLLGTPQAVTRLRWSQELNPLYDYIKGMRITESMSSQNTGIKLYSATTMLNPENSRNDPTRGNGSFKFKKPPSVILEESESETGSPQHGDTVPLITHSSPTEEEVEKQPMIYVPPGTSNLSRPPRRTHLYEEVELTSNLPHVKSEGDLIPAPPILKKMEGGEGMGARAATLAALANPVVRRLQTLEAPQERSGSISPRLGKRQLQQRRSRTIGCVDDTEAITRKQRPVRVADTMKDFSFVMREYRLFYIKMPNGKLHSEVFSINKPVSELREKLCDLLGVDIPDNYLLYVEGACLTSLRDEVGEAASHRSMGRSSSLTHINDHQWLPDQGSEPILLKPNLSFRMQGITTSRVLAMMSDDVVAESNITYPSHILLDDETEEFHKNWISIVQGNVPCTQEQAVKLAAIQYQAYFLDRTAVHSVVGFCRPTEFLPIECSTVRGVEQKMYKEQERLKLKTHKEVHEAYIRYMSRLPTFDSIFFPVREPRKKVLQSTKLKPVILGVSPHCIMRVDPKTKEVLDVWEYQVLRNWAYSRKTFVLAFTDKNYPVESNQAKWISMLVDFHVDSIINTAGAPSTTTNTAPSQQQPANS